MVMKWHARGFNQGAAQRLPDLNPPRSPFSKGGRRFNSFCNIEKGSVVALFLSVFFFRLFIRLNPSDPWPSFPPYPSRSV